MVGPWTPRNSYRRWQRIGFEAGIPRFWVWFLFFAHGFTDSGTRNSTGLGRIFTSTRGAPLGPKTWPIKSPSTNPNYINPKSYPFLTHPTLLPVNSSARRQGVAPRGRAPAPRQSRALHRRRTWRRRPPGRASHRLRGGPCPAAPHASVPHGGGARSPGLAPCRRPARQRCPPPATPRAGAEPGGGAPRSGSPTSESPTRRLAGRHMTLLFLLLEVVASL